MTPPRNTTPGPRREGTGAAKSTEAPRAPSSVIGAVSDPRVLEINETIARAKAEGWIIVAQPLTYVAPMFRVIPVRVDIDPNPDAGDVYVNTQNGTLALRRIALMRLADAMGIDWPPGQSRRIDDGADNERVIWQAAARVLLPNGTWRPLTGTYEVDVRAREVEYRQQLEAKRNAGDVEQKVARERAAWLRHKIARAETGAVERLIASLGIERAYPPPKLRNPFLVTRVIPDAGTDVDAQRLIFAMALGSAADLYTQRQAPPPPAAVDSPAATGNTLPRTDDRQSRPLPGRIDDFATLDPLDQVATLEAMMKQKGYTLEQLQAASKQKGLSVTTVGDLPPEQRAPFYKHLRKLQNVIDDGGEEIPF
jgi:hypothetical protein